MPQSPFDLSSLQRSGLLRTLEVPQGADFSSNDYLGLSRHPLIRAGLADFLQTGAALGATGSRLVSGHTDHIARTEDFLAQSFSTAAALIFGSGYLANLGIVAALGDEDTEFFSDALNHASLVDGLRLAKGKKTIFAHNNMTELGDLVAKSSAERKIIVTESLFSMDGDFAPLGALAHIAAKAGAYVVFDEAHTTGTQTLGEANRAFDPERTLFIHTCGKALGAYGAFVGCSEKLKNFLLNRARTFIYTTALPPLLVEQIRLAVTVLRAEPLLPERLQQNILLSQALFGSLGHSESHIVPLVLGSNEAVNLAARLLKERGFFVRAIRSPTVAPGSERLRITIKSFHEAGELALFADALKETKEEVDASLRHRN